jgi:hypothetical protein
MIMKSAQSYLRWLVGFSYAVCLLAAGNLFLTPVHAQDAGGDPNLSAAAGQVLKLAASGVGEDTMLAYVQNAATPFNLSADDVTYLHDQGLSSPVLNAMMNRDKALAQQPAPYNYNQQLYGGTGAPPAPVAPPVPVPAAAPVPVASAPPTYVSDAPADVTYFYSDLTPYGSWVNLEGYGWCWQPTTVTLNPGWQPYCDGGHWVYTDDGWFWDSDYSWGWAPFHYGRWHHHDRVGWVWFPDRVWGPAWVTWRMSGNECGWAPLPLHATFDAGGGFFFNGVRVAANFDFGLSAGLFTFVAFNDFAGRDLAHHRLGPGDVSRIYGRTTVINDYRADHGNIVNRGIPVDRLAAVTHATYRPVPVREAPAGMVRPGARGGQTLEVYRRDVQPPARPVAVRAQQVDDRHPFVQHTVAPPVNPERRTAPAPQPAFTPARSTTLPPSAPARPPVVAPSSRQFNVTPEPSSRAAAAVNTPAPTTVHGKTPAATSRFANQPEPGPFVAGPNDLPKPKPAPPAPAPKSQFDYLPRSQNPTVESHSLPPLPPKPAPPAPAPSAPSTVSHDYTPRMVQATQAHALPPLPTPAPTRSQPPASTPAASGSSSSAGGKSSGGSGSNSPQNGPQNGRQNR